MNITPKAKKEYTSGVEPIIRYHFINPAYCWIALQCKGASGLIEGNKRLALIVDEFLRQKILMNWYSTDARTEIGQNILTQRATNSNLAKRGRDIGLHKFICPNRSQKGTVSDGQVADTVEAILGAIVLDGGEEKLEGIMRRLGLLED